MTTNDPSAVPTACDCGPSGCVSGTAFWPVLTALIVVVTGILAKLALDRYWEYEKTRQLSGGADGGGGGGGKGARRRGGKRTSSSHAVGRDKVIPTAEENAWEINYRELQFKKVIGKGNMGAVYLGMWRGSEVAIKTLLDSAKEDDGMRDRFQEEIKLMMMLHHPNVLTLIGVVMQPSMCLVLEYCSGGDVYTYLHNPDQKMSWAVRFQMAIDTARGMYYLHHRAGIIQRDLKSANLLLDENMRIKIADFGLSRTLTLAPGAMETYCGTPSTMAPEIVLQEDYTEKSDVFSYAVILHEFVTREEPYDNAADKGVALAYAVANQGLRPTIPSYCPEVSNERKERLHGTLAYYSACSGCGDAGPVCARAWVYACMRVCVCLPSITYSPRSPRGLTGPPRRLFLLFDPRVRCAPFSPLAAGCRAFFLFVVLFFFFFFLSSPPRLTRCGLTLTYRAIMALPPVPIAICRLDVSRSWLL